MKIVDNLFYILYTLYTNTTGMWALPSGCFTGQQSGSNWLTKTQPKKEDEKLSVTSRFPRLHSILLLLTWAVSESQFLSSLHGKHYCMRIILCEGSPHIHIISSPGGLNWMVFCSPSPFSYLKTCIYMTDDDHDHHHNHHDDMINLHSNSHQKTLTRQLHLRITFSANVSSLHCVQSQWLNRYVSPPSLQKKILMHSIIPQKCIPICESTFFILMQVKIFM